MRIISVLFIAMVFALAGCAQMDTAGEANATLAQRYADEVWSKGNVDMLDELIGADFTRHNPASIDPSTVTGIEAMKDYVTTVRTRFPDFKVEIQVRVATGDFVAMTWTASGTPAETQKSFTGQGMSISRFAGGKIVEEWSAWDTFDSAQQLGLIPSPGEENP